VTGRLAGKVVAVTGSTRGIGRAIALSCGREGATVVVNGRTDDAVAAVLSEMRRTGATASGVTGDVSSPDDVQHIFDHAIATHGRIDVWFNNAGLSGGFRPLDEFSPEEILEIADVNLGGVMLGCRVAIPYLREHGGVIVNLCGRGSRNEVAAFGAAYAATKSAIASLTRSVAAENRDAKRLTVCGLLPGMVPTDFYRDMTISPKLADRADNVTVALDAFGASLEEVGAFAVRLAAQEPGTGSGTVHSVITRTRAMRGVLSLMRARMSGRMKPL
jgi:NAD(P)-dependent dehydrogenase (short-subunit alcohol dehydrogenase family)